MSTDHAIAAALIAVLVGLWVRRTTWTFRWECAATINLAAILICLVCMMPRAAPAYDPLHSLTGVWNLEDLLGHLTYLAGITVLTHVMLARLTLADLRAFVRQRIELPATILLPTLIGVFVVAAPNHHVADLVIEPAAGWLTCYWLLLCGCGIWVLAHLLWALLIIHGDPQSATIATLYIVAVLANIGVFVARGMSAVVPAFPGSVTWTLICMATVAYATAAIVGMRRVRRWLTWPPPRPAEPPEQLRP